MFDNIREIVLKRIRREAEEGSGQPPPAPTPTPILVAPTPPPPTSPASDMTVLLKAAFDELGTYGLNAAIEANEVAQIPMRREVLHLYAEDRVRCLYMGPFDPINNPGDALIQEAIDTAKARERKQESELIRATALRNEAQRNVPADQAPPRASLLVVGAAIVGFALAFGSSIYELPLVKAFDGDDGGNQGLLISFAIGAALGTLCVCSMFGIKVHDEKESASWSPSPENPAWQLIAGLVMILAFGLIRTYAATGSRDWLVTLGLMGIDTAVLMYAKGEAARHRRREEVWAQRCDGRLQKMLLVEVAEAQRAAAEIELERMKAERIAAEGKLEARLRFNFDLDAMIHAGISAVDEGYFLGIDKNNGRLAA